MSYFCWSSEFDRALDLKEFIACRRFETLSLHHVLQNFSTTDCDWLIPPGQGPLQQARVSVSDALKRRELLEDFVFWYFDSFVVPLLKASTSTHAASEVY
jgi:telomerase reverse transcriptase